MLLPKQHVVLFLKSYFSSDFKKYSVCKKNSPSHFFCQSGIKYCFCFRTQSRWCCRWTYSWVWETLCVFTMVWESVQNAFCRVSLTIITTDELCLNPPRDRWASSTTLNHTVLDMDSMPPTRSLIPCDANDHLYASCWWIMLSIFHWHFLCCWNNLHQCSVELSGLSVLS